MWSTLTRMDFCIPEDTMISGEPPGVAFTLGQNAGPERMLGPILLIPVTRMSFLQFSAVSCVHRCPSMHQSQGKGEETQEVQEVKVLQSKKVKLVAAKSRPSSPTRTDSLLVKWDSPLGIFGSRSFLTKVKQEIIMTIKKLEERRSAKLCLGWDLPRGCAGHSSACPGSVRHQHL